jgi:fibronectin-binding autotransporter adhesin
VGINAFEHGTEVMTALQRPRRLLLSLALAIASFAWAASGHAQTTRTWRLAPTDALWSTGANWTPSGAPVANDSVAFSVTTGPTTLTNDITAGTQFNGITFNAGASAYTLTGNQITLGGSVINNSANLQTIGLPLELAATRTFAANSGGITVAGAITGTGGITKDGRDTLTLAGTNTFSGNIAVRGGTLLLDYSAGGNTADPLGTSSAITLNMGTLVLKGKTTGTTTETISALNMGDNLGVANTLRLDANGGDGIDLTVTTFGLAAQAGSSQNINLVDLSSSSGNSLTASGLSASTAVINGVVMQSPSAGSGRANLVVRDTAGYGFATLSGATSGTLGRLTAGTDLTASNSSATANYRLTTAGTLTRTAALDYSTLTIDSSAGAITVDMGANNLAPTGSGRGILVTGPNNVSITGSGALAGAASTWFHNYSSGTFTLGLSTTTVASSSWMLGGTGLTVWTGTTATTASNNDKLYIEGITFRPTTDQVWVVSGGTTNIARGNVYVSSGGVLEVGADLNGAVAGDLSNQVTNGGGGILFYGDSGVSAFGGDRVVGFRTGGTGALESLTWGSSHFLTQANGSTDGNFIFKLSSDRSDSLVTVENNIALGSLVRTVEVANGSAAVDADLSGVLSGVGGLTKTGVGTLRLSRANTFTGPATIAAGTLVLANADALSGAAYSTDNAGTLSFGSLSAASLGSLSGSTSLALENVVSSALALTVGGNGGSTTFSGVLSGPGSLTKAGGGTFTLSADNTYAGTTTVNAGTLVVGTGGATGSLGAGSMSLGGGTLQFNRSDSITLTQPISGTGTLGLVAPSVGAANAAVVQLEAANTFSGTTLIGLSNASSPLILAGSDTAFGSSTIDANLQFEPRLRLRSDSVSARTFANDLGFSGNDSGGARIAVLGSVGSGSLAFTGSTSLPDSLRFEINGEPVTFSGATSGAGIGWRKMGVGTLAFAGAGGPTGPATINNGTVVADYATADPLGTNAISLSGSLVLRGASGGGTSDTIGAITTTQNTRSEIIVENGAAISAGTLTSGGNIAPLLVDLTGGGSFTPASLSGIAVTDGILQQGSRANLYVKDSGGIGFGTLSGSSIVRYTGATALTASNTGNTTNFATSSNVTRSAALAVQTLAIDTAGGPVTLAMGSNNLAADGNGRGLLVTGNDNASITGTGAMTGSFNIANYSTGTLSVALGLTNVAVVNNGPGLVTYSTTTNPADVYVTNGVTRFTGARNYTSAILRIYGGGVFEIGADLNGGSTAGDFTRAVSSSTGGVAILGTGGFSAHGADRVVNLGGSAAELTWGTANFLADPAAGDYQYAFKLGSAFSNATLEFQNPIALNGNTRTIDVARGTLAGGIDARLTGALSGDAASGLAKAGLGTLVLSATSSYLGETLVGAGRLVVDGSIAASSGVNVSAGAELAGTGRVAAITGGGLVAPGNSPGILTAPAANLSGGLDFAFEFAQAGGPTWGSAANSGNDVLRLTDLSAPFIGTATAGNVFDIYFAATDETYLGGLFTDRAASFESLISGATFNYFVRDASGPVSYQGFNYSSLSFGDVTRSTVQVASAAFAGGTVTDGYTMQFVIVPEPQGLALAGLGMAVGWLLRRRFPRTGMPA